MTRFSRSSTTALATIATIATIGLAPAPAHAGGALHLGVGDCSAAGSTTASINNACTSNNGVITLFASFNPSVSMNQFLGMTGLLNIFTGGSTLSPWWHMEPGGCRAGKISVSFNFVSGPSTCTDFWQGGAMGGYDYTTNLDGLGGNSATLRVIQAVAETSEGPIQPSIEYYAFEVVIQRVQSTGPGNCSGCLDHACFAFSGATLAQPAGVGDYDLSSGVQNVVPYNGGVASSVCPAATVQKSTWGQLKAVFR